MKKETDHAYSSVARSARFLSDVISDEQERYLNRRVIEHRLIASKNTMFRYG